MNTGLNVEICINQGSACVCVCVCACLQWGRNLRNQNKNGMLH